MNYGSYICEHCKGTFKRIRPDSEALEESKEIWGELKKEDLSVICDECYNDFMKWYRRFS